LWGGAVEWGDFDIIQLRYGFPLTPLFEQEGGFSCLALVAQGLDPCWVHMARFWTALTSAGLPSLLQTTKASFIACGSRGMPQAGRVSAKTAARWDRLLPAVEGSRAALSSLANWTVSGLWISFQGMLAMSYSRIERRTCALVFPIFLLLSVV